MDTDSVDFSTQTNGIAHSTDLEHRFPAQSSLWLPAVDQARSIGF